MIEPSLPLGLDVTVSLSSTRFQFASLQQQVSNKKGTLDMRALFGGIFVCKHIF